MEIDQDGKVQKPSQILVKDYHLSYPSVFMIDETYFMIPETSSQKTIELYECVKFPFEWKFRMNLMEGIIAVDTTPFYYHDKWWLFTSVCENEGAFPETELFLFYSDIFFTKIWKSHPLNPIISDVKIARPAGDIFMDDGKIYRPSQDCSRNYGWGVNINEILLLTETEYLEKKVSDIKPDWDQKIMGIHTFARKGSMTIVDAVRKNRKIF